MRTYTSARISKDALVNIFGIELGIIDCECQTIEALELIAEQVIQEVCLAENCDEKKSIEIIIEMI